MIQCVVLFFSPIHIKTKVFIRINKVHHLAYYSCRDLNHTSENTAPRKTRLTKRLGRVEGVGRVRNWAGGKSAALRAPGRGQEAQRAGAEPSSWDGSRECGSFMNTASWWRPKVEEMWPRRDNCPDSATPRSSSADMNKDFTSKSMMLSLTLNMLHVSFCPSHISCRTDS